MLAKSQIQNSTQLKGEVARSHVLALSGRGGEFTQPSLHLLAEYCTEVCKLQNLDHKLSNHFVQSCIVTCEKINLMSFHYGEFVIKSAYTALMKLEIGCESMYPFSFIAKVDIYLRLHLTYWEPYASRSSRSERQ